ncbi:hypothetical protein PR202_gb18762 [Eleusine coracana subsp. coracana]|uniref:Tubulin--tyrosine ligase-like protein 12 SET-like domain-containing protein n=1 Tax=Eleusine coracana subsp. coracana TaxID=191504 RepID=A0AAV5F6F0_ELECO|nr:hypothetical protein PR202_gb18762 [Eleusine coracana subsp. coracana]
MSGFTQLQELEHEALHAEIVSQVDIPGPLGNSAISIIEALPNLSLLNGLNTSSIIEGGKHIVDSALQPRLPEWSSEEPLAERVIGAMWLYLMTYRLADEEKIDETPVWYVMDELGSAIRHSDDANFRIAPFLFMPEGKLVSAISYTVLWPTHDVQTGEECTRDFLFANEPKEADIIWVGMQVDSEVKNALGLTDQQYTNQFPFEACLVMKHHLAETIHKVRLANNQYTLEKTSFFEYETHFTVMNYIGKMNHINTPEFVKEFEKEHQGFTSCILYPLSCNFSHY